MSIYTSRINAQVFTQNVDILTRKMVSIIIENVKNIKDKEDEIN
jgi:hypothetical protein